MNWIDTAKGMSIILVVMMYATYNTGEYTGEVGFLHYVISFATPFRMPEFFMISGLFLSNVIARPWRRYADRRVLHYFYFYAIWVFIMLGLKVGLYEGSPMEMLRLHLLALVEPYGVLWFIYMLGVFGIAAKLLWQFRVPHWIVLPIGAGLQMAGIHSPSYFVTQFAAYFVFFYLGYVIAPIVFALADWAGRNTRAAILALILWAWLNALFVYSSGFQIHPEGTAMGHVAAWPPLHFVLAIAGSLALCVGGVLLSRFRIMGWLRWLGEHSLVVYLSFTIPMSIFRGLALWSGLLTDTGPLSLAVLIVSIGCPVILYFAIRHFHRGAFLFERPRWAHIPADRKPLESEPLPQ